MVLPVSRRLSFSEIPIISLKGNNSNELSYSTVEALKTACTEVGFFYVIDHGIELGLIHSMVKEAERFFAQPISEKCKVQIDQRIRGYLPLYYRSYEGEERAGTSHQEGFWIGHDTAVDQRGSHIAPPCHFILFAYSLLPK